MRFNWELAQSVSVSLSMLDPEPARSMIEVEIMNVDDHSFCFANTSIRMSLIDPVLIHYISLLCLTLRILNYKPALRAHAASMLQPSHRAVVGLAHSLSRSPYPSPSGYDNTCSAGRRSYVLCPFSQRFSQITSRCPANSYFQSPEHA